MIRESNVTLSIPSCGRPIGRKFLWPLSSKGWHFFADVGGFLQLVKGRSAATGYCPVQTPRVICSVVVFDHPQPTAAREQMFLLPRHKPKAEEHKQGVRRSRAQQTEHRRRNDCCPLPVIPAQHEREEVPSGSG